MTAPRGNNKLDDPEEDDRTMIQFEDRPCQRCHVGVWSPPHSICRDCIEQSRAYRVLRDQRARGRA